MRRVGFATLLAIMIIACGCMEAAGEDTKPRDVIHAYRVWKLTEVLDLSEETMPVFFSRLKDLDEKEIELVRQEQKSIREIADLLRKQGVREEELERALEKHERERAKLMEEVRTLRKRALAMLDTKQRCSYVVFEHRFRAELRDIIDRTRAVGRGGVERRDPDSEFGIPDPGGRGVGGGMPGGPGGSGRGRR